MKFPIQRQMYQGSGNSAPVESTQTPGVHLTITLLAGDEGWRFDWPATGASYYRVVLYGKQLDIVTDLTNGLQSYTFDGPGFFYNPPPLEIMEEETPAMSELNRSYLTIQWYGNESASYYQVQEEISGDWVTLFEIAEVESSLYTWVAVMLADASTHNYRVMAFNTIDQSSTPLEFDITPVVTTPDFIETMYDVTYDDLAETITLDLVS